jgi:hypothetical protein
MGWYWVHFVRRPLVDLLYQLRMLLMNVEQSVEWELARETEVLGEDSVPVPLCPSQIPHDLDSNPGRRGGKPVNNRLNYDTALIW